MGGEHSPSMVVEGIGVVSHHRSDLRFILYGDEKKLNSLLAVNKDAKNVCRVVHTDEAIAEDIKPSQAIRNGSRNTSMRLAIQAVKDGETDGVVSAGNTGALMAISKLCFRTLQGVHRPAIVGLLPTQQGRCVMLDIGGNTECSAMNLVEFAIMGNIFAKVMLGVDNPRIGLLNIGSEEMKGREEIREAAQIIRESSLSLNFQGFIEGHDIGAHKVDVVVTDGFTGNVALKTLEGTAKVISKFVKDAVMKSLLLKLAFKFAPASVAEMREKMDPRKYNGAMFVGLNGVAVKSHGGADAIGFATAIETAADIISFKFNEKITKELELLHEKNKTEQDIAI